VATVITKAALFEHWLISSSSDIIRFTRANGKDACPVISEGGGMAELL